MTRIEPENNSGWTGQTIHPHTLGQIVLPFQINHTVQVGLDSKPNSTKSLKQTRNFFLLFDSGYCNIEGNLYREDIQGAMVDGFN